VTPDHRRRRFLSLALSPALALLGVPQLSSGEPSITTARLLNGYPPGGVTDIMCRKLSERLSGIWARHVIVDNRSGAAGRVAVEVLKAAPPDGSAMLVTPGSVVMMYPHVYKNLSYDVFADLTPVSVVAVSAFALTIGPAVPASVSTLPEFTTWCKSHPSGANCGNAGAGSFPHFMAVLFAREAGIDLIHVPFRGGAPALQAVMAGDVAAALVTEGAALQLRRMGKARILATTNAERSAFLPEVPTFSEFGYSNLSQREWFGAFMPPKTPADLIASVAQSLGDALQKPDVREVWNSAALSPEASSPLELKAVLRRDYDFWGPIIKASGFTAEA
jgi:tripartite-type tricarboxylate transporter receptor subunit TctC